MAGRALGDASSYSNRCMPSPEYSRAFANSDAAIVDRFHSYESSSGFAPAEAVGCNVLGFDPGA
jgi:hypothetical protein